MMDNIGVSTADKYSTLYHESCTYTNPMLQFLYMYILIQIQLVMTSLLTSIHTHASTYYRYTTANNQIENFDATT